MASRVARIASHLVQSPCAVDEESYPPPAELAANAHVNSVEEYRRMWQHSVDDPAGFWGPIADQFTFFKKWTSVVDYDFTKAEIRWFDGSQLNVSVNVLDRHVEAGHGDWPALTHEADDGANTTLTYKQLLAEVCKMSNTFLSKGVKKGDCVTIYAPMVLNLAVACLACARIGAIHNVVFGGFSAESVAQRILDCKSAHVFTYDAGIRGGKIVPLKSIVDKACDLVRAKGFEVRCVFCGHRAGGGTGPGSEGWVSGRDVELESAVASQSDVCAPAVMEAEDPLFILYTSGSTGVPKGVLHTQAGYMIYAATTMKYSFDIKPETDVHFCTADIGWITGHTYLLYGPLLLGAHSVLFEGTPTYPNASRLWEVCDKLKVTKFYTAPTALRSLMVEGDAPVNRCKLDTLQVLGTVGEPINPEAWRWYHRVVGKGRCPIVDTFWQSETGGHVITPLPGVSHLKPGAAMSPFFGIRPKVIRTDGSECKQGETGFLVFTQAWPGMMRTVFGDHERFRKTYFSQHPGNYFTGDGARIDEDGCIWIMGRIDDVLNVSGHRMSTAEVESAIMNHPLVCEVAVVGFPHKIKGEGIYCFVSLEQGATSSDELRKELVKTVRAEIGAIASPDAIHFTQVLPKTRSGKIMRRLLRKVAQGDLKDLGDTSTLADPSVVEKLFESRVVLS